MRKYLLAALCAGTLATPAFAQDQGNLAASASKAWSATTGRASQDESADGVAYGVGVGYDFQSGNAVFGIEAEATDSSANERVAGVVLPGDELRVRAGRDLYVGGRVGAVVGGRTLLYAKAGYTNARVRVDYEDGTAATINDFTDRTNLDGVRAGAGAQFAIGSNAYPEDGISLFQLSGRRRPPPGRRRLRLPLLISRP